MENIAVKNFMSSHVSLFNNLPICRGLYILDDRTEEIYILECQEYKGRRVTYVFCFNCGCFHECRTEVNTFEKYLMTIHEADYAEFIKFEN